jgi:hypothetical protein
MAGKENSKYSICKYNCDFLLEELSIQGSSSTTFIFGTESQNTYPYLLVNLYGIIVKMYE